MQYPKPWVCPHGPCCEKAVDGIPCDCEKGCTQDCESVEDCPFYKGHGSLYHALFGDINGDDDTTLLS